MNIGISFYYGWWFPYSNLNDLTSVRVRDSHKRKRVEHALREVNLID